MHLFNTRTTVFESSAFISRIGLPAVAMFLVVAILSLNSVAIAEDSDKPDIVLILADDLGYGDLGCFGGSDLRTPVLDGLADRGQKWTNFYANCCVCSPTRAALLTGRYPDQVGVPGVIRTHANNSWGKLAAVPTLPEMLKTAGYQTTCIGKWHLGLEAGDHPLDRGFDRFEGFLGDMMDDYFNHRRFGNNYMRSGRKEIDPEGHATSLFSDWAVNSIDEATKSDKPYFLYLAFNAPHTPIQPPQDALERVKARAPEMPEQRAKLVALIEDMDAAIGRVLEQVAKTNRDTLIIFTSDNGGQISVGANNGPLRDGKGSKYEGGLRVPAIVSWPGRIKPGSTTKAVGISMDVMPTLAAITGTKMPAVSNGVSLLPWLKDSNAEQAKRELYFVRREGGLRYSGLTIEALLSGDLKLVHNLPTQSFELFDLKADPLEQRDLSKTNPKQLRQMISKLQLYIQAGGRVPWQP